MRCSKSIRVFWPFIVALALLIATGCERETPVVVKLDKREKVPLPLPPPKALTVAIGAMITPKDGYVYYSRLLDYLGERTGLAIRAVDRGSYREINELLHTGAVDAAFVCGGPYVQGKEEFDLEILAVPVVQGETVYYSYLIVPSDSPARGYEDLRGKAFAFTDPHSNTGALVPTFILARMGETPDSFFASHLFTYGHDRSIRAVAEKVVDGAAIDHLIWHYLDRIDPDLTRRTRIIHRSDPFGIPPIVVGKGVGQEVRDQLREALLTLHLEEKGREILQGMMIDRFVTGDDSAYDSIRAMRRALDGASGDAHDAAR